MIATAFAAFSGWDWLQYALVFGGLAVVLRREIVAVRRAQRR